MEGRHVRRNKRVAAAQQTRAKLIETGLVLAEELGLEGSR